MRLPSLKEIVTGASLLAACALPLKGSAAPIVDISFSQKDGASGAYVAITNPDFTYDSATVQFDGIFNPVAQYVKDNNSNYSAMSLDDIKGLWGVAVSADGEVYTKWSANLDGGVLDLTHSGLGYDQWLSTSEDSTQDRLRFDVNFFDQLDINHNGQFDSAFEQLACTVIP